MVLNEYTPAKVAAITGLSVEVIGRLAREFGEAEGAVAIAGKGKGAMPTPVYDLMAVQALNALVGNINQSGGVIVRKELPLAPWPEPEPDPVAEEGLAAPRLDMAGTEKYPLTSSLLNELIESINTGRFYPVNVLILDRPTRTFSDPTRPLSARPCPRYPWWSAYRTRPTTPASRLTLYFRNPLISRGRP
jgi:hypothetical protein